MESMNSRISAKSQSQNKSQAKSQSKTKKTRNLYLQQDNAQFEQTEHKKRFEVVSLHPYLECDMQPQCRFCYKKADPNYKPKPEKFWLDLIPHIAKLTNQIAQGGGEPFMHPNFVKKMAIKSKQHNLFFNITTNGRSLMACSNKELTDRLKNITMISISFDDFKVHTKQQLADYFSLVRRIKIFCPDTQVGCNLLVSKRMFEEKLGGANGKMFIAIVSMLFANGIDRVFALCPKNMPCPDILKYKAAYHYLTMRFPQFYVDDLGKQILKEGTYKKWKEPCHFGKGIISINESGAICGCSFDKTEQALLLLNAPKDILKLKTMKIKARHNCPYLQEPKKWKMKKN